MTEKFDIIDQQNVDLQKHLEKIPWSKFLNYGSVKVQVRDGKPTLVTIERTVRMDYCNALTDTSR